MFEIPITDHPDLPAGVPLVADFHDMRNRLSYYYPVLRDTPGVRTPITKFFPVEGDYNSCMEIEYREITEFMQDQQMLNAFVRGDYSSGKFDGDSGSRIASQDPWDIETVVLEMIRQLSRTKRWLGGRVAVREWIPHDVEVRFFIRNGGIKYWDSVDDFDGDAPELQAAIIASQFSNYSWSCDFIRHEKTDEWYCIDMGLDGLYWSDKHGWIPQSEHLQEGESPARFAETVPRPESLKF